MFGYILNYEASRKLRSFLSRRGVNLRFSTNTRPVDFTSQPEIDPVAAIYQAGGRPILLNVSLQDCIFFSHLAFPCSKNSSSPQIQTLVEYGKGNCLSWEKSPLVDFYNAFQPKNAAEMMGLKKPSNKVFLKLPPSAALTPWSSYTPFNSIKVNHKISLSESRQYGLSDQISSSQFHGPTPTGKIKLEFTRLNKTYKILKKERFLVDYEGFQNITATILKKNNNYKFFILSGQHRIAALSALGKKTVVLQIHKEGLSGYIDISHSKYWSTVQRGYLSIQEAEFLFTRIYNSEQPSAYTESVDHVHE